MGAGTYPVNYADDPTSGDVAKPADVVFVALKAHQVPSAAAWFEALVTDHTVVVAAMNGVEHEAVLRLFVGAAEVIPVVVMLPAHADEPGRLMMRTPGALSIPDGEAARRVAGLFTADFLTVKTVDNFAERSWRKLMGNAVSGGLMAVLGQRVDIEGDAEARALIVGLYQEVMAVAAAEGVMLPVDLPERMTDGYVRMGQGHLSSIAVDRIAGRPTEWRYRNEVVIRLAEHHGIEVPLNRMLTTLLRLGEPPVA